MRVRIGSFELHALQHLPGANVELQGAVVVREHAPDVLASPPQPVSPVERHVEVVIGVQIRIGLDDLVRSELGDPERVLGPQQAVDTASARSLVVADVLASRRVQLDDPSAFGDVV